MRTVYSNMSNDHNHASREWIFIENDLLQVLMEMQKKWAMALQAAHSCQRLKEKPPHECIIHLDTALKEAKDLKILLEKYIITLEEMKDLVQSA
jgi:hypothetical protein